MAVCKDVEVGISLVRVPGEEKTVVIHSVTDEATAMLGFWRLDVNAEGWGVLTSASSGEQKHVSSTLRSRVAGRATPCGPIYVHVALAGKTSWLADLRKAHEDKYKDFEVE